MTPQSNMESLAERFAPHIEMLREFLASRGMPFGAPRDLYLLIERLSTPSAFDKDMASMLRTIVFREGMSITRVELLELVTIAVGGAQVEEAAQEIHEPVGKLLAFINEVLRSLRRPAGDDPGQPAAVPTAESPQTAASSEAPDGLRDRAPATIAPPSAAFRNDPRPEDIPRPSSSFRPNPFRPVHSASVPAPSAPLPTPQAATVPSAAAPRAASTQHPPSALASSPSLEQRLRSALDLSPQGLRIFALSTLGLCVLAFAFAWSLHRRTAALTAATPHVHVRSRPAVVALPAVPILSDKPATDPNADLLAGLPNGAVDPSPAPENSQAPSPLIHSRAPSLAHSRVSTRRSSLLPSPKGPNSQNSRPLSSSQRTSFASTAGSASELSPSAGRLAYRPSPATDYTQGSASGSERTASERAGASEHTAPTASALAKSRPQPAAATRTPKWQGVSSVSSGVMTSHLLSAPPPEYPKVARLTHVEGEVILQAVIARDGTVATTHALRGHHLLRSAAEHAVRRWRYRPYLIEGHPTEVATIVTVDFHLHR